MSEKELTQEEVYKRAANLDQKTKTLLYDDACLMLRDMSITEFINAEVTHHGEYVDEPKPVLRQAATNAAANAVEMMAEEGTFMD